MLTPVQRDLLERAHAADDGCVMDPRNSRSIAALVRRGLMVSADACSDGNNLPPRLGCITQAGIDCIDVQPNVLEVILEMVDEAVPEATCASWTARQRVEARDWAGAVHLRASDNGNRVPPRPAFLPSRLRNAD